MERKIGEIFEFGGEWYQCIIGHCNQCSFDEAGTCKFIGNPYCAYRNDKKLACFKKLEKVGEPYEFDGHLFQSYHTFEVPIFTENYATVREFGNNSKISIEIKQNKEDMEDLDKIKVRDYTKVEELNVMEENKLNLKPFDIQKAREGKPVCTRDGRKVRVLCYDFKQNEEYPILVAVENKDGKECALLYSNGGISEMYKSSNNELAMLPEKKEGWVNVYKGIDGITFSRHPHISKEKAIEEAGSLPGRIDTVKVFWEE